MGGERFWVEGGVIFFFPPSVRGGDHLIVRLVFFFFFFVALAVCLRTHERRIISPLGAVSAALPSPFCVHFIS